MIVKTIGSGSSGNGYALISGEDILLLECGVPAKEMLKAIDYQTSMVNGCILSHIHGDHAGYIKQYIQYGIMVYTSDEVETDVETVMGEKTIGLQRMKRQKIGSFEVVPFHVPHNIYENKLVALDDVALVTEEGFFVDALAVKELNSKLKNAETTMSNNLKSLLSVKQVTVKSNINVGAGKDFECYIKAPTVSGYTPVGIIGYDLVGNWDVWINVSSCYYNSGSNLIYTKGHNFGTGACNALLNAFVLYKKN